MVFGIPGAILHFSLSIGVRVHSDPSKCELKKRGKCRGFRFDATRNRAMKNPM